MFFFIYGIIIISKTIGFLFNFHLFKPNGTVFPKNEIPVAVV